MGSADYVTNCPNCGAPLRDYGRCEYYKPEAVAEYAKRDIRNKMADALTDSIKFIARREFDPRRFEEVITVRGELWISDPDVRY